MNVIHCFLSRFFGSKRCHKVEPDEKTVYVPVAVADIRQLPANSSVDPTYTCRHGIGTILFCDMKKSTTFMTRLERKFGFELAQKLVSDMYREWYIEIDLLLESIPKQLRPKINQRQGDGFNAEFGVINRYSYHALAMLIFATKLLRLVQSLTGNVNEKYSFELNIRIGISSGYYTSSLIGNEHQIVGSVMNQAARMESSADPGQIMIHPSTFDHLPEEVQDCFQLEKHRTKEGYQDIYRLIKNRNIENVEKNLFEKFKDSLKIKKNVWKASGNKALIVDDSKIIRKLYEKGLSNTNVRSVNCSKAVKALLQSWIPTVCMVDRNLDERGDGLSLTSWIRKEFPDMIIILMTADYDRYNDHSEEAAGAGADDYWYKNRDISKLGNHLVDFIKEHKPRRRRRRSSLRLFLGIDNI